MGLAEAPKNFSGVSGFFPDLEHFWAAAFGREDAAGWSKLLLRWYSLSGDLQSETEVEARLGNGTDIKAAATGRGDQVLAVYDNISTGYNAIVHTRSQKSVLPINLYKPTSPTSDYSLLDQSFNPLAVSDDLFVVTFGRNYSLGHQGDGGVLLKGSLFGLHTTACRALGQIKP